MAILLDPQSKKRHPLWGEQAINHRQKGIRPLPAEIKLGKPTKFFAVTK
jgi:hypothetical protein